MTQVKDIGGASVSITTLDGLKKAASPWHDNANADDSSEDEKPAKKAAAPAKPAPATKPNAKKEESSSSDDSSSVDEEPAKKAAAPAKPYNAQMITTPEFGAAWGTLGMEKSAALMVAGCTTTEAYKQLL